MDRPAKRPRTEPAVLLLDGRGRQLSSEAFADLIGARRDEGTQHIVFAIGPADGWSESARAEAQTTRATSSRWDR
ncbi:MAG: 23S rRNA (pseudouridine(1915)-N(3))-methyltransferase RlmH [Terracidiphilus sp.]